MGSVWILTIILAATYSGNLIAFLASSRKVQRVNSLHQAYNMGIQIGIQRGNALSEIFANTQDETYKKIWNSILINDAIFGTYKDGYNWIKKGTKVAYLEWDETYHMFDTNKELQNIGTRCDFVISKETAFKTWMSIAVQKDSPLLDRFTKG